MSAPQPMTERHGIRLVIEREVREALRHKALWITAALAMAGAIALVALPGILSSDDEYQVGVVGAPSPAFVEGLGQAGDGDGFRIETEDSADAGAARRAVRDGDLDAAVVIGPETTLIVEQPTGTLTNALRSAVAQDQAIARLQSAGLDQQQIDRALSPPEVAIEVLDADRGGRIAAAVAISLATYLLLFFVTMQVANGVAIEKSNRVSEVLLAIVPPRTLLFGKVAGVGITALLPLLAAALPVVVRLTTSDSLPPGTGSAVAAAAAWFVLGAGFYLLAAGALGALVERQEDAGSTVAVLSILLVGSYLVGQTAADSPLGVVLAYLPFSAPMVEPARLALGVSSPAEVVGSLLVSVVSLIVMARVATAVYGRAVVRTGTRLRLGDVLRTP